MTFEEVWDSVSIDAIVTVSNGKPAPPASAKRPYDAWRSNNCTGPLRAKLDATEIRGRRLRIEAVNEAGLVVAFDIAEGYGHSFELAE